MARQTGRRNLKVHMTTTRLLVRALQLLCSLACFSTVSLVAQSASAREGFVITADSTRLFYRIAGTAPDTVIAIHGGPGVDLESIYGDFLTLAKRHTVIFYDQRGAGRSTLPRDASTLNATQQVADLEAVRLHFRLERVTLVAHSYGPLLAATYALAHPQRVARMVFFGPVPPRRGEFWQRFAASVNGKMDSVQRRAMSAANRRLADTVASDASVRSACMDYWALAMRPRLADPARGMRQIRSNLCASDARGIQYGLTRTNGAVMASYGDWDLRGALRTLNVPTLVVHGEAESIPMDLVEEWTTTMPRATLIRVPRAAHFAYAERPALVWPAVEAFLSRTLPRR